MFVEYMTAILVGGLFVVGGWLLLFGTSREAINRARDHFRF
jgi:hypothetical protein